MRRPTRLRRHLTYANVCATLALFIAVSSGTAVASKGLIDGRSIKPNSIPARALQNNSVTSAKIKNGQVRSVDIGKKQVTAANVKNGSLTPQVFTASTQKQLASIGGGGSTGEDPWLSDTTSWHTKHGFTSCKLTPGALASGILTDGVCYGGEAGDGSSVSGRDCGSNSVYFIGLMPNGSKYHMCFTEDQLLNYGLKKGA